jgi:hypothetical protein
LRPELLDSAEWLRQVIKRTAGVEYLGPSIEKLLENSFVVPDAALAEVSALLRGAGRPYANGFRMSDG